MDSAEISGTNHFKNGPIKREVCEPENRSVEKKKMTPIHAATQTHGLIFGLAGEVLIVVLRSPSPPPSPAGRGRVAKRVPLDSFSLREKVAGGRMRVNPRAIFYEGHYLIAELISHGAEKCGGFFGRQHCRTFRVEPQPSGVDSVGRLQLALESDSDGAVSIAGNGERRGGEFDNLNRPYHGGGGVPAAVLHVESDRVNAGNARVDQPGDSDQFADVAIHYVVRCRPGIRVVFPGVDRDALFAFQRDHRRDGIHHRYRPHH